MSDQQQNDDHSDDDATPAGTNDDDQHDDGADASQTFDLEYVQRLRKEAKRYRLDAQNKQKRVDELEEANKSEHDKLVDRVTKAEQAVEGVPAQVAAALKTHLVELHKISDDDAELLLTAQDPDLLLKQVARLVGQEKNGTHRVPREGRSPQPAPANDEQAFVRELFAG